MSCVAPIIMMLFILFIYLFIGAWQPLCEKEPSQFVFCVPPLANNDNFTHK